MKTNGTGIKCSEHRCREYLARISAGEEKALEDLYIAMNQSIFLFAMSYCKNKETAEDVVQETFVRLITGIGQYREQGYAKTWIFTIAKNLCMDALERQKPRPEITDIETEADFTSSEVSDALSILSESERQIIRFSVFGGLPTGEIAGLLHSSPTRVRYARRCAMKKLKKYYGENK